MWKDILSYLKEYKIYAILSPIFMTIEAAAGIAIPYLMGKLVDEGVAKSNMDAAWMYGGYMLLVIVLALTLALFNVRISGKAAIGLSKNLRQAYFEKIQGVSFSTIDQFSTGSLVTRVTTDITFIQNAFFLMIRLAFRAPVLLVLSIVMTMSIRPILGVIFIVMIPIMYIFMLIMMGVVMPFFAQLFRKIDRMNSKIQEKLTGIRVLKSFVRETYESKSFDAVATDVMQTQKKAEKFIVYIEPLGQFLGYFVAIFTVWAGGVQLLKGSISAGQLTSFISYSSYALLNSMLVMMAFGQIIMASAPVRRVSEVLNQELEVADECSLLDHTIDRGEIEFIDVTFKYDAKKSTNHMHKPKGPFARRKQRQNTENTVAEAKERENVLKNINLKIEAGQTIGILGSTGSGKSTLAQLIPRLYKAKQGTILIDGIDINDYKIKDLRTGVSMVLQKNVLFSGTIKDNLLWGNDNATDEEIRDACEKAQAKNFVESFEQGYETMLEQGASNLSGGQKQRLCIARALLRKPKILILDDSTSAVDMSTEAKIRNGLKEAYKDTTLIIIAQRISSVIDADKIIVMNNGEINAIGEHKDLIKNNEIYKDVYSSQMEGVINA